MTHPNRCPQCGADQSLTSSRLHEPDCPMLTPAAPSHGGTPLPTFRELLDALKKSCADFGSVKEPATDEMYRVVERFDAHTPEGEIVLIEPAADSVRSADVSSAKGGPSRPAAEVSRLADVLPREDHACSTGDCGHDKQSECDETLARDYSELTSGSREFTLHFDENAENPKVRVESELIKIKFNEVVHVIEKSAYDKMAKSAWETGASLRAEIEKLKRERDAARETQHALVDRENRWRSERDELRCELEEAKAEYEQEREYANIIAKERDEARAEVTAIERLSIQYELDRKDAWHERDRYRTALGQIRDGTSNGRCAYCVRMRTIAAEALEGETKTE